MYIELQIFVCYIASTAIFLLLAFCNKYKSPWREFKQHIKADLWEEKDIDDFLHYLSHEYVQFCTNFALCMFDYLYWITNALPNPTITDNAMSAGKIAVPVMLQIIRFA